MKMDKSDTDYYIRTEKFFGRVAKIYGIFDFLVRGIRKKVVEMSHPSSGSKILDLCTGTGEQAIAFSKNAGFVVGVDLSKPMLEKAADKESNVTFILADALNLPFKNDSFDMCCISFALHEMPHDVRHKVLNETKRVSEKIVVVDYHIPKNRMHRWFHVSMASLWESEYFKDFAKRDLGELLQQHGLRVVKEDYGLMDFIRVLVCEAMN